MSYVTRGRSIGLISAALIFSACGKRSDPSAVRVGSMSTEVNTTIAEVYAAAMEQHGISVDRRMRLGDEQSAMAALQRADIDLYPRHVTLNDTGKTSYERRYGITWLSAAPANDSPCFLTSQYAAEKFWLLRLTKCAALAPKLRLATTAGFVARGGPLERLRKLYGGFDFKTIDVCRDGTQYFVLNRDDADVATGSTTDGDIAETQLVVLSDDKHFWPEQHVAPALRLSALHAHPRIRLVLDRISQRLSIYAIQRMTARQQLFKADPRDIAEEFVLQ